jgi:hypothetical protein
MTLGGMSRLELVCDNNGLISIGTSIVSLKWNHYIYLRALLFIFYFFLPNK